MSLESSWTEEATQQLAKALTFCYKTQTTYKEPLDLKDRVSGWKFILEDAFTVEQVLYGIKKHMKQSPDMPVPASIHAILSPDEPKITEAQYVQACKWQERNCFPVFSEAKDIKEKYEAQNQAKQEEFKSECAKIQSMVSGAVNRIGDGRG